MMTYEDYVEWRLEKDCKCNQWNMPCGWCEEISWYDYVEYAKEEGFTPHTEEDKKRKLEMKLNRKNFAEFFRTDYYTVKVKFVESERQLQQAKNFSEPKEYTYKVSKDLVLGVGDKLLVCTHNEVEYAESLKVVYVVSINHEAEIEEDSPFQYKWIVGMFNDVMADYRENVEKDQNLKRGVHKLEQALERVSLRNQLKMAMLELDDDTKKELAGIFGMKNLALENGDGKSEEKNS